MSKKYIIKNNISQKVYLVLKSKRYLIYQNRTMKNMFEINKT